MSKDMAPVTRALVTAVLGSGVMATATVGVVVLHAIMFGLTRGSLGPHSVMAASAYLWSGTAEAASTASAAVVLYGLQWRRLTPGRWLVVGLGAASTLLAVGLWIAFQAAR